jgi:hypothetical protein
VLPPQELAPRATLVLVVVELVRYVVQMQNHSLTRVAGVVVGEGD